MKILELFSGTGSFSEVAREKGCECFTIDNDKQFNPNLCKDILNLELKDIPFKPGIIWASPPCTDYSHAKRKGVSFIELSNMLVIKTISLILALKPKFWVIENPQTGTLKFQYFMVGLPYTDVSYCMYGKTYRKQTRLWNNFNFKGKVCNHIGKHKDSVGNARKKYTSESFDKITKGSVPRKLCLDIIKELKKQKELVE